MALDNSDKVALTLASLLTLFCLQLGVFVTINKYQERQVEKLRIIAGADEVAKRLEEVERKINRIIQLNGMSQDVPSSHLESGPMNLPNVPKDLFSTTEALRVDGPIDLADALGLMFVYLKLTGQIGWSWWWVTAPFWIKLIMLSIVELSKERPEED